jgi:hypothetical protein
MSELKKYMITVFLEEEADDLDVEYRIQMQAIKTPPPLVLHVREYADYFGKDITKPRTLCTFRETNVSGLNSVIVEQTQIAYVQYIDMNNPSKSLSCVLSDLHPQSSLPFVESEDTIEYTRQTFFIGTDVKVVVYRLADRKDRGCVTFTVTVPVLVHERPEIRAFVILNQRINECGLHHRCRTTDNYFFALSLLKCRL